MDEAKAPPPTPERSAATRRTLKGALELLRAIPARSMGMHRSKEVMKTTLRPPDTWVMKELGMRRVPPESPATPGRRKRMDR